MDSQLIGSPSALFSASELMSMSAESCSIVIVAAVLSELPFSRRLMSIAVKMSPVPENCTGTSRYGNERYFSVFAS